jgi:hypothetical protein
MMEYLNVVAIIVAGLMVGRELAIVAFVHPTLDRLPDVHLPVASALARVLGRFMPVLVHPRILAYVSRGLVPMAPIQPLTYLDCYVGRFVVVGECVFDHCFGAGPASPLACCAPHDSFRVSDRGRR